MYLFGYGSPVWLVVGVTLIVKYRRTHILRAWWGVILLTWSVCGGLTWVGSYLEPSRFLWFVMAPYVLTPILFLIGRRHEEWREGKEAVAAKREARARYDALVREIGR